MRVIATLGLLPIVALVALRGVPKMIVLIEFIVGAWISFYWWVAMAWAAGDERVSVAQVWAGQGVIVMTLLIQMAMKWRSDRMQYQREERQRRWDREDRAEARQAATAQLEETKREVVGKVEETKVALANGVTNRLREVLAKFDELPDAVAGKAAEVTAGRVAQAAADLAADKVADKVVEKLKSNGPNS